MKTLTKSALALVVAGSAASANASLFYFDTDGTPVGFAPDSVICDGNATATCSGLKEEMTFQYDSRTEITLGNGALDVGDAVTTTGGLNIGGTFDIDYYDGEAGVSGLLPGGALYDVGVNRVTDLDPGSTNAGFAASPIFPGTWGIGFTLDLVGTIAATDGVSVSEVNYTSGLIELFIVAADGALGALDQGGAGEAFDYVNVFDLTVDGSSFDNASNFEVFGNISFGTGDFAEDSAFNDFFKIDGKECASGTDPKNSFYSIGTCVPAMDFSWIIDQNLDSEVAFFYPDGRAVVAGDHDGSLRFNVPEPSSVALFGLGLLGLGAAARKRK